MTTLQLGKSVTRKVAAAIQHRELVVTLHAGYMELRRAGTRTSFSLSYGTAYTEAARIAADRLRAEKKAAKKGRS